MALLILHKFTKCFIRLFSNRWSTYLKLALFWWRNILQSLSFSIHVKLVINISWSRSYRTTWTVVFYITALGLRLMLKLKTKFFLIKIFVFYHTFTNILRRKLISEVRIHKNANFLFNNGVFMGVFTCRRVACEDAGRAAYGVMFTHNWRVRSPASWYQLSKPLKCCTPSSLHAVSLTCTRARARKS